MAGGAVGILGPSNLHGRVAAHALQMVRGFELRAFRMLGINGCAVATAALGRRGRKRAVVMAGCAERFRLGVEGLGQLVVLDAFHQRTEVTAVGKQGGFVFFGQLADDHLERGLLGCKVGHGFSASTVSSARASFSSAGRVPAMPCCNWVLVMAGVTL